MNSNLHLLHSFEKKTTAAEWLVSIYELLDSKEVDTYSKTYLNELACFVTAGFENDNYYGIYKQDFAALRNWTKNWTPAKNKVEVKRIEGFTTEKLDEIAKIHFQNQLILMQEFNRKRAAQIKRARAKVESLRT